MGVESSSTYQDLDHLETCYGVSHQSYCAYQAAISKGASETERVQLCLPDGSHIEQELPRNVPISAIKLALHLKKLIQSPPSATALVFANASLPDEPSLCAQGVSEQGMLELQPGRHFAPTITGSPFSIGHLQLLWPW